MVRRVAAVGLVVVWVSILCGEGAAQSQSGASTIDYFTEEFSTSDNDLSFRTLTFTPDGSENVYRLCTGLATTFPIDPSGATRLPLTDDSADIVTLSDGATVPFYGMVYNRVYVGSNGYLTFMEGDATFDESLAVHFAQPRLSGLFDDLDPQAGGRVSWQQLDDRLVVTYADVPEFGTTTRNSFQIELFFDGVVRLTYLALAARDGLVGLSAGQGVPADFQESDFSAAPLCAPPRLTVTPERLAFVLNLDAQETQPLILHNDGTGPAQWAVRQQTVSTPQAASAPQAQTAVLPDWHAAHQPEVLLVGFQPTMSKAARAALHASAGTTVIHRFQSIPVEVVRGPAGISLPGLAAAYHQRSGVAYVEPNYRYQASEAPNDPRFSEQWGLHNTGQAGGMVDADIDALEAWAQQRGSTAVVVGIIDSGIDYNHVDLQANMWTNAAELQGLPGVDDDDNGIVDDIHGARWTNGTGQPTSGDPLDDDGHGTHVAGICGAVGNNGTGGTGVSQTVRLMALKFLDATGFGFTADAIAALEYAVVQGAHVTNNSWSGAGFSRALQDAIAAAGAAGQLFVAAAGNDAANNDDVPQYPGSYDLSTIVAVASSTRTDTLSGFSNFGSTSVDLAAPGSEIVSTTPGDAYTVFDGTSMATPHVTGTVALLLAAIPGASPMQVRQWLLQGVDVMPTFQGMVATGGRLNAAQALALATSWVSVEPTAGLLPAGEAMELQVTATAQGLTGGFHDEMILVITSHDPAGPLEVPVSLDVLAGNSAPRLDAIADQTVTEGDLVTFTATATDPDAGDTLSFSLGENAPAAASINARTGVFRWRPSEADGPGTHEVVIEVHDDGIPVLTAQTRLSIRVAESNQAPVLESPGNQSGVEGEVLSFTAHARDVDLPANTLRYQLAAGAPAGATLHVSSGVFRWRPGEAEGPGTYEVTVEVYDNGIPVLSDRETLQIMVAESNQAPVLEAIDPQQGVEGELIGFTARGSDADIPANTLRYQLRDGAPTGASMDATTGEFRWVPDEAQGPGTYDVTVEVHDNGTPVQMASAPVQIMVAEVNTAPVLESIAEQSGVEGEEIRFTIQATDADEPANTLRYQLGAGAPAGASLDPNTGVFTWTPTAAEEPGTYEVTVEVHDDGTPSLIDSALVRLTVTAQPRPNNGDVNGDGVITPADALSVMLYVLRRIELNEEERLRANVLGPESGITSADGRCILRRFLQLPSCLD